MMSHNSVGAGVVSQNSGTPSEEDEKTAGSGVGTMNGHEKASADPQTILVDSSGKQQEQANNNNEALAPASVEVPIEQTNYGHDASTNSPDRNYSKITKSSEADVKAADSHLAHKSYASVLSNNVVSHGNDGEETSESTEKGDSSLAERQIGDDGEKEQTHHKRIQSMPVIANEGGATSDVNSGARSQGTSMNISPTKSEQKQQPKQMQQQEITNPNTSQSSEDDDNSVNLPQTLQQSTIVEKSPAERYIRFKEKLGSGAYKDVYRAYDTIEGIEVAWNVVKLFGVPKAERVRIVNEVRLLERLHHPNIISFHGSWVNRETERVIFVTEILSSGTLKSFVSKVQLVRWKIFKRWAIQILKGLEYLHSQDPPIIHRDLKCDNIFINGTSGDLRIGDFGLSTAINNKNQPLSVLGTPEFMAPELYDESYNEKVDIYAFGMLLLEIATNQVPYHECANPAQIYKKVTSGIAPASLRRVKSEKARNFILLCLGIGQDASLRPSATELLNHPFLAKHPNDENTIEVEPAIEEMVIDEMAPLEVRPSSLRSGKGVSLTISDTASEFSADKLAEQANSKYCNSIDGHEIPSKNARSNLRGEQDIAKDESTVSSKLSDHADAVDDQFGEMPENEANMKPVKVMMGRGTALDENDSEPPTRQLGETTLSNPLPVPPISTPMPASVSIQAANDVMKRSASDADNSTKSNVPQFIVSLNPNPENPSPNETEINLALTLPDENRTTVEFEFDLVNDDPVQIAKEMVMELDEVPNDSVLDISEAISGVARTARQQKVLQQQQHFRMASQGLPHQPQQQQQPGLGGQQEVNVGYPGMGYQTPGAPMGLGNDVNPTMQHQQQSTHLQYQTPGGPNVGGDLNAPLQQQHPQQQALPISYSAGASNVGGDSNAPAPQQHSQQQALHASHTPGPPPPQHMIDQKQMSATFQTSGTPNTHQQNSNNNPQQQQQSLSFQSKSPVAPLQQQGEAAPNISVPHHLRMTSDLSLEPAWQQPNHAPAPSQMPIAAQQLPPRPASTPQLTQQYSHQQTGHLNNMTTDDAVAKQQNPAALQPEATSNTSQSSPDPSIMSAAAVPQHMHPPHMVVVPESSALGDEVNDEVDDEELKKLELEFEKRLQRAKKSYGTRMDNLQRSKVEAEAMHQMTLEKHEKERVEFEKRVRLAEEEQNRRLNQIEQEFREKKDKFRQQRDGDRPPLHGGHKRSSSHFEASLQCPTPATDMRRNSSMTNYAHASQHKRDHSTQSSISYSASDISEDHLHVDLSPKAPSSGNLYVEETKSLPSVRQVESSTSLRDKDRSESTSS